MIFDLHNDFLTALNDDAKSDELLSYSSAKLHGCIFAVWTSKLSLDEESFSQYVIPKTDFISRLAIEDLGSVEIKNYLQFLSALKPAYVSLTWNGENRLGGGTGCESALTDDGKRAISALNALGIPLDLSHLSDIAFYQAIDIAEKLAVTHTASRALCRHPRCLTDEMAKIVANRGGIIGIAAVPNFLDDTLNYGENCTRDTYARHICKFVETVGAESVAIGTDFNGAEYFPTGMTCYADFACLKYDLTKYGLSEEETDKIFYKNAERFFGTEEKT